MEQLSKKKIVKDCYGYQMIRYCSAEDCCLFYHRDLTRYLCPVHDIIRLARKMPQSACDRLIPTLPPQQGGGQGQEDAACGGS